MNKSALPLVSIVTPVFNSERFIKETIQSVINQSYQNWEHILVDDCSSDNSTNIIKEYTTIDPRIKFFKLDRNSGSGPARNLAIKIAQGRYIAFIDSDDVWIPDKLKRQVNFMLEKDCAVCHASYGYIDETGKEIRRPYLVSSNPVEYKYLLKRTDISCLTAMFDQDKIGKFYMPKLRRKQDYGLWLNILRVGNISVPYNRNEILAYYRQHSGSATSNKRVLITKHYFFLRNHEKLSRVNSLKYTCYWIIGGVKKHFV